MRKYLLEILLSFAAVTAAVWVMDDLRLFRSPDPNNHTAKRWAYYYDFTRRHPLDVLIIGNSHAYTGLLPKRVSCTAGLNCFMLASGGITLTESCYILEEALTRATPKVVVIETYTISGYRQKHLGPSDLSLEFKSFAARRNIPIKLRSTPHLFTVGEVPYAWSQTLRNHDLIFDRDRMRYNLHHLGPEHYHDRLYLGRFVRFNTGLTDATLEHYRTEGPPVDGTSRMFGPEAESAMGRILDICRRKGIAVLFLTLPMYPDHVSHTDVWMADFGAHFDGLPWLNLQGDPSFGPESFEDTYRDNQHMTYRGAAIASDRLAGYLRARFPALGPPRFGELDWLQTFYGEDGFYENVTPPDGDPAARVLDGETDYYGLQVKELDLVHLQDGERLILKVLRTSFPDGTAPAGFDAFLRMGDGTVGRVTFNADVHFNAREYLLYNAFLNKDTPVVGLYSE